MYKIASISKTITATALMILYEKGLFQLDEDISDILGYKIRNPHFPLIPITPRMLLSHTSSIQDGDGFYNFVMDSYSKSNITSLSALFTDTGRYATNDLWQLQAPGTYFYYSNLNYGIIGTLIEKISGKRFDIFCKENILKPLGIKGSFNIQDVTNTDNVAVLYRMYDGIWQPQADNFQGIKPKPKDLNNYNIGTNALIFSPQSSLRISATDLSKFMIMLMDGGIYKGKRILKESTVNLMLTPQWKFNGKNGDTFFGLFLSWGLGFQLTGNKINGDFIVPDYFMNGHIGDAYGLISNMFFNKEKKFGMIFITNGSEEEFEGGHYSAFNSVEEDVFSALFYQSILPSIQNKASGDLISNIKNDVYPSINNDHINFRYYLPVAGNITCTIINDIGEKVSQYVIKSDTYGRIQIPVETKGLKNGLYNCLFQSEGNYDILKFNILR